MEPCMFCRPDGTTVCEACARTYVVQVVNRIVELEAEHRVAA